MQADRPLLYQFDSVDKDTICNSGPDFNVPTEVSFLNCLLEKISLRIDQVLFSFKRFVK